MTNVLAKMTTQAATYCFFYVILWFNFVNERIICNQKGALRTVRT